MGEAGDHEIILRLRDEAGLLSAPSMILNTDAFRSIVAKGEDVVPSLIEALGEPNVAIMVALQEITGENPVPPEDMWNVEKMADAWIAWAER